MADLFHKQAKQYSEARPTYPPHLFDFIASKTPIHDLVWDVGTGSGQAALSLAEIYKNVVATDTSEQQLAFAPKRPNIRYHHTPPTMTLSQLHNHVAPPETVDLVTVAQALHWFDLPDFYTQVTSVLRKPHGVLATWCYTVPSLDEDVDPVFRRLYKESGAYWAAGREKVDDMYRSIEFPFKAVEGVESTGPFEFVTERKMGLEEFLTYVRSWSAYQTAKSEGVELLSGDVVEEFQRAWGGEGEKVVSFAVYLRIGKVGN